MQNQSDSNENDDNFEIKYQHDDQSQQSTKPVILFDQMQDDGNDRILAALKFYQSLSNNHQKSLMELIESSFTSIMDDYIEIISNPEKLKK